MQLRRLVFTGAVRTQCPHAVHAVEAMLFKPCSGWICKCPLDSTGSYWGCPDVWGSCRWRNGKWQHGSSTCTYGLHWLPWRPTLLGRWVLQCLFHTVDNIHLTTLPRHVMVGITRSKVIFFSLFFPWPWPFCSYDSESCSKTIQPRLARMHWPSKNPISKKASLPNLSLLSLLKGTLPETNIAAENSPSQKETSLLIIHFQGLC